MAFTSKQLKLLLFFFTLLLSCAGVQQTLKALKPVAPQLQLQGVSLQQLNFQSVTLGFQFSIHNPNPFQLSLNGFSYELFLLSNHPLVKGDHRQPATIPARGDSSIILPLSITFKDVLQLIRNIPEEDSIPYTFQATFRVNIPVLGELAIPVTHRGKIPLIRPPQFRVKQLAIDRLNWQGARLLLRLEVENPNRFPLTLSRLNYQVQFQEQAIANGQTGQRFRAGARQRTVIEIPLELNFLKLGQSLYRLLTSEQPIPLRVQGAATLTTPLPLLQHTALPFNLQTQIKLK